MYRGLRTELQRAALFLSFCLLIGWLLGHTLWVLMLGCTLYGLFLLRQMQRFYLWLSRHSNQPPPSSSGIWGDIFDAIARMLKKQALQQQDLQQQLTRMQDSTAALKDGVVLLDHRNQIVFWNDAANRLLGLRRNSDENQPLTNLLRDPLFVSYFSLHNFNEPLTLNSPINNTDFLEIQISEFGQQEKLLVFRDVTRLKQLEKIRSDFVANVSHELRTPLTVLKGYVESMDEHREQLDPRWHKALTHMQQQALRMQELINDLTLLSRLENRQTTRAPQPVAIDELARRIRDDAQRLSLAHPIILTGQALTLLGRDNELHSAFSNLVTNALRYSPPGSTVNIRWGTDERGAYFSVEDHGPGIAAVHIPRLTERFYRVDSGRGRADGGTGLGLAIVKYALARHNAVLEINSSLGKGSTFTCRFDKTADL